MTNNEFVRAYTEFFNYKQIINSKAIEKNIFLKNTSSGDFIVIESCPNSKYVNFYLNDNSKVFKKSDLFLGVMENSPIAWEVESE